MADGRTPDQIEADITRRRRALASTLEEIGVRVHPKTVAGSAQASVREALDRTAGRAYVAVNRVVSDVRAGLVTKDGAPRLERIVPVAVAGIGVAVLVMVVGRSRRARK